MRILTLIFVMMAPAAGAHPGHIIDVAGHGHWIGAVAIGLAILLGLRGKGKDREDASEEDDIEKEATA